jgi:hypothetical protein
MKLKLAILPLCLIALNVFGFEGTIKQTVKNYNGTGTNVTMTWYIGAHNCRIDMNASGGDLKGSNSVVLVDPGANMLKTYEIGGAGPKNYFAVNAAAISGGLGEVKVTKTADIKVIQGYSCEKWTVTVGAAMYNVWITRDIDFDAAAYKEFFKNSIEIQALAQQGIKGFALLTESGTGTNASTSEKVTKQPLSAETFSVPAGYTPQTVSPPKSGK